MMSQILGLLTLVVISFGATAQTCRENQKYLDVDVAESKMRLCDHGTATMVFHVSLGRGGVDKKANGDARTPIGKYELGVPRPSNRFIQFIPIGYPTESQRQLGFTGGDVGVHGPLKNMSWLGRLNTMVNWTNGCIAVGSESEISDVADWVVANHVHEIVVH